MISLTKLNETLYLVTGAAGFLGSHVCHQLLERGERVRTFVLDGDPAIQYIPKEAEIVKGDLCDIDSIDSILIIDDDNDIGNVLEESIAAIYTAFTERGIVSDIAITNEKVVRKHAHG